MNTYTAQVGLKAQTGASVDAADITAATLAAEDYRGNRKESNHRIGATRYERGLQRGTQTPQASLPSQHMGMISWTEELVGGTGDAAWIRTLQGMGFVPYVTGFSSEGAVFEIPATAPTVFPGMVMQTTGGAKKILIAGSTASAVYAVILAGTPANLDAFASLPGDPTASFTATGAADAGEPIGICYRPQSEVFDGTVSVASPAFTVERRLGGQLHRIVGSRATGGLSFKAGEPMLLNAEFTGVPIFQNGTKAPIVSGAGFLTGVAGYGNAPKVTQGMALSLRTLTGTSTETVPIATECTIDFGNTVELRPSIAQPSGFVSARITGRKIVGRIDPEHILPGTGKIDWIKETLEEDRLVSLYASVGKVDDPFGRVIVCGPRVRLAGDVEPGDRNGRVTMPLSLEFTGEADDEFYLFHIKTA